MTPEQIELVKNRWSKVTPIADRLKTSETCILNSFNDVTVLFADLVGFTALSTQVPPTMLVRLLDQLFSIFDELTERHGLEKIKTIGDAYMAAAGIPFPREDHASAAAKMALDMHQAVEKFNSEGKALLKLRIGICSGPVIGGVIGQSKLNYDLWGDTVNTASRMESHGEPGRTHVAAATYEFLRDHFQFEERGTIDVKGKGSMKTYFLCGPFDVDDTRRLGPPLCRTRHKAKKPDRLGAMVSGDVQSVALQSCFFTGIPQSTGDWTMRFMGAGLAATRGYRRLHPSRPNHNSRFRAPPIAGCGGCFCCAGHCGIGGGGTARSVPLPFDAGRRSFLR
jgi:class 3 adenylate cyclase